MKAIPDSQSDTSSSSFLSHNIHQPTNRNYRPKVVGLGEERKPQTKSPSHYAKQDSMDSSGTGLLLNKNEHTNRLSIREIIRLGENRKNTILKMTKNKTSSIKCKNPGFCILLNWLHNLHLPILTINPVSFKEIKMFTPSS